MSLVAAYLLGMASAFIAIGICILAIAATVRTWF